MPMNYRVVKSATGVILGNGKLGSRDVALGNAYTDTGSVGSTLWVNHGGYLISNSEGAGAEITDYAALTVDGILSGEGKSADGLDSSNARSNNTLALEIGRYGEIYGSGNGVNTQQTASIDNYGRIEGANDDAIYEHSAKFGGFSLINVTSGDIVGYEDGLYLSTTKSATQTVMNSGLIEGEFSNAIELSGAGASSISNGVKGQVLGYNGGIYDHNSTGAQTVSNAGLIDGYDQYAIYFDDSVGAVSITNAATGKITGEYGIYDENASSNLTITNLGLLEGGDNQAVYVTSLVGAVTIVNAANAQIYGNYGNAIDIENVTKNKGAATSGVIIDNAGSIKSSDDYGIYLDNVTGPATIDNAATGQITSGRDYGIYVYGATGAQTIVNSGLIEGGDDIGVYFDDVTGSVTITNYATGRIIGADDYGIYVSSVSAGLTLINFGQITGSSDYGLYADQIGGAVVIDNSATGTIVGGDEAGVYVYLAGAGVTINNMGVINGGTDSGADIENDTGDIVVTNGANARIFGGDDYGLFIENSAGNVAVRNAGLIEGGGDVGIYVANQAGPGEITINNGVTGQIIGSDSYGIEIYQFTGPLLISNAGFIQGADDVGVYVDDNLNPPPIDNVSAGNLAGGRSISATVSLTNSATGNITAYDSGVSFEDVAGAQTISNSGLIWGDFEYGVEINNSGSTTITNSVNAVIKGEYGGIYVDSSLSSATLTIVNGGTLAGPDDYGVYEDMSGGNSSITNSSTGKITGEIGVYDTSLSSTRTIVNTGYIAGTDGDGIAEYSAGAFNLTNNTTGVITGTGYGVYASYDDGLTANIVNDGQILGGLNYGIEVNTNTSATIVNSDTGLILGDGGIDYISTSAKTTLTFKNAGTINGGAGDSLLANGGAAIDFTNSSIMNGNVVLGGLDNVAVTGGTVTGNIDMTASSDDDIFAMSGGHITGAVEFGAGAETISLDAGAAGTSFDLGVGKSTFDYKSLASYGTTAATRDTVNNWQTDDVLNVSALLPSSATFGAVNQNMSGGNDVITLTGSNFSVELAGVTAKLTSANFTL